jgi:hypothetical protein
VAWGFTTRDVRPFLEYLKRDLMFREAVIGFLTGGDARSAEEKELEDFCRLCKKRWPDKDCGACSRKVEVQDVR